MPDMYSDEQEPVGPEELCRQAFSRCSNWPQDHFGQIGLAQDLKLAADRCFVSQEDIIAKCRETSAFCPTGHDILQIAGEMAIARRAARDAAVNKEAEWRKQYGPPQPIEFGSFVPSGRHAKLWAALRKKFPMSQRGKWPNWLTLAEAADELGYPDYAEAWRRSVRWR